MHSKVLWIHWTSGGNHEGMHIDKFIEVTISSGQNSRKRRIEELQERLEPGDALLVTELSRLGRSTGEVIILINMVLLSP